MLDSKKFVITLVGIAAILALAVLRLIPGTWAAGAIAVSALGLSIGQGIADGWSGGLTSGVANKAAARDLKAIAERGSGGAAAEGEVRS